MDWQRQFRPRFLIDAMIDGEMLHFTMKNEGNVEIYQGTVGIYR